MTYLACPERRQRGALDEQLWKTSEPQSQSRWKLQPEMAIMRWGACHCVMIAIDMCLFDPFTESMMMMMMMMMLRRREAGEWITSWQWLDRDGRHDGGWET